MAFVSVGSFHSIQVNLFDSLRLSLLSSHVSQFVSNVIHTQLCALNLSIYEKKNRKSLRMKRNECIVFKFTDIWYAAVDICILWCHSRFLLWRYSLKFETAHLALWTETISRRETQCKIERRKSLVSVQRHSVNGLERQNTGQTQVQWMCQNCVSDVYHAHPQWFLVLVSHLPLAMTTSILFTKNKRSF